MRQIWTYVLCIAGALAAPCAAWQTTGSEATPS